MMRYAIHSIVLACAAALFVTTTPAAASARTVLHTFNSAPAFSVVHKLKKQSTGSSKRLSQKHDHVAKQKKEKKWHKKSAMPGQSSFAPKKYRK